MVVEGEPEQLSARIDLVPMHSGGERRLLELLLDRFRLETVETGRPDEPARVHEPRELVAREERLLQRRVARHLQVLGVGEGCLDQLFGIPLLAQNRGPVLRMLVERGVNLVVEVVQESRAAPELLVLAVQPGVEANGSLDRERVAQERFALRVLGERCPRLVAGRPHGAVR